MDYTLMPYCQWGWKFFVFLSGLLTHALLSTRVAVYCFMWITHSCRNVNEGGSLVLFSVDYPFMPYCQRGWKFCVVLCGLLTHALLSTAVEVLCCLMWITHSCPTVNEGGIFVLFYVDYPLMPYYERGWQFCVVLCGLLTHALLSTGVKVLCCLMWIFHSCPTINEGGSFVLFDVDYSLMPYCQRGWKFCVVLCGLLTHSPLSTRVKVMTRMNDCIMYTGMYSLVHIINVMLVEQKVRHASGNSPEKVNRFDINKNHPRLSSAVSQFTHHS